ncbi:hypothetical protein SAMN05444169_8385 [Bradyrhizobium erythrophlei]|uniref:Bll5850 protein n=2 Tax=Bradyrhizobium erythrophlei TaxID=1437360 RepID=A0A1M5UFW5_9BRAD|nr:hypothetical protein SAMN05444169_8385 [Bradyrhizobium erythrophlei]
MGQVMSDGGVRRHATWEPASGRSRSSSAMAEMFLPLDRLLGGGGDPRLSIDPASGLNQYGCRPLPCPGTLSFASSTATSISERAYARASDARESLMRSAIAVGIEQALDARIEAMRGELKDHFGLSRSGVEVVFSPSGTDSQLQALFLTRAVLGPALTTVIVAADQTGSGTGDTARGRHFSTATASGSRVRKGEPVAGLAHSVTSVALPLFDATGHCRPQADSDSRVLSAVEKSLADGSGVLLQIMDSSKLGWRAPSEQCLDEIRRRWPDRVQIVVDACQMRLGRPRLRKYLDRGCIVIVTGSKFFTGPAFSGALLVPAGFSGVLDAVPRIAPGLYEYSSRGDWPSSWPALRARFPVRANFGQWLRWEAALAEIRSYYSVPDEFRSLALTTFGQGVKQIIASSRSLHLLPPQETLQATPQDGGVDDEELAQPTIFPFVIRHEGRALSLADCRKIHRALSRNAGDAIAVNESGREQQIAAQPCLVGQPVALGEATAHPVAALRICAGARLVTEAWSPDGETAAANVRRELGRVGAVVSKIEWLLAHLGVLPSAEPSRGALSPA